MIPASNPNQWIGIVALGFLILSIQSLARAEQRGAAAVVQTTVPKVTRIGQIVERLSDKDVADLERVLPTGRVPWLLRGIPNMLPQRVDIIAAYLPATTTLPELRRGPTFSLSRPIDSPQSPWTLSDSSEYVQVAIGGRDFDEITSEGDINMPFSLSCLSLDNCHEATLSGRGPGFGKGDVCL